MPEGSHSLADAPGREAGVPGEEDNDRGALNIEEGGTAIPYKDEDPHIRDEFSAALAEEGVSSRMEEKFYTTVTERFRS